MPCSSHAVRRDLRRIAMTLVMGTLAVACGDDTSTTPPPPTTAVTAVTVTPGTLSLSPGTTASVTAAVSPTAANAAVTWTSESPAVATVSASGAGATITAVAAGTTVIRATSTTTPAVSGAVTVTVSPRLPATLTVSAASATLVPGQPFALTIVARDSLGVTIAAPPISWTTSAASVATVEPDGRINVLGAGSATITAATPGAAGPVTASSVLTVNDGGWVAATGGTVTAQAGAVQIVIPSNALASAAAITVRPTIEVPAAPRLLPGTAVTIESSVPLSAAATVRLRYPTSLAADVVETNLRLARVVNGAWSEAAPSVARATRLVGAASTTLGTWAIFVPPPSLRGHAQAKGIEIGTALAIGALISDTAYRRVLRSEFNSMTHENALKFGDVHPSPTVYNFAVIDSTLAFTEANGMRTHGHVLLWHNQQPGWLTAGTPTRASLMNALREHITTVVTRYAGRIASWDVANEVLPDDGTPLRPTFWVTIAGPDIIDSAFVWARRADPNAKLYLNDYAVEGINRKSDSLFALANRLKARGVPIDGVGLQGHFMVNGPTLASMQNNLARFANAGFDLRITELDVRLPDGTDNLAEQAEMYGRAVEACLGQPRCKAVTVWGFTDRHSWIPGSFPGFGRGAIFDANYQPKPAYTLLRDLLAAWGGRI